MEPQGDKVTVDDIRPLVEAPSKNADPETAQEEQALELRRQKAVVKSIEADTAARGTYANRIFCLVLGWIMAVFLVLFLEGYRWFGWQPLPEHVVITLVGTSTISILGILASVIAYIFRVPKSS